MPSPDAPEFVLKLKALIDQQRTEEELMARRHSEARAEFIHDLDEKQKAELADWFDVAGSPTIN